MNNDNSILDIEKHKNFMKIALNQAKIAEKNLEVPVGAVIVRNNEVVSVGYNQREVSKNCLAHAEILAINQACLKLSNWRLSDCELYVTLEPCLMCTGAIINSRISKVIYGADDKKSGSLNSILRFFESTYNPKPTVISEIMKVECSEILSSFFECLRNKN